MRQLYAELHRNILDVFNEYGVQIMTPAYEGDPGAAEGRAERSVVLGAGEAAGHGRSHAAGGVTSAFFDRGLRKACGHRKCLRDLVQRALNGLPGGLLRRRERPPGGHRADLGRAVEHRFGFS